MNDIGIRTFLTFYGDSADPIWPFGSSGEHTWEGHRLPAVPVVGSKMQFATIPKDKAQVWEVFAVTWVYGENARPLDEQDRWHLEVALR